MVAAGGAVGFVFPGQGSQYVGMGQDWAETFPAAREAFAEADSTLGFSLSELCWQGPEEELQLTANTQPAILATSVAIQRVVADHGLAPVVVAGHSLGEYSALVTAGCLSFADALRLVRRRGELMQEAVPVGIGAMAAIMGLEAEVVAAIAAEAKEDQVCDVANYTAPIQTVVAGHREAVERAVEMAEARDAMRAVMLPVSAPFHSALMRPARDGLTPELEAVPFADPQPPVVTNIDAVPVTTGEAARQALVRQIDGPVRWVESIRWMADEGGVETFLEIGPRAVLSGLIRRITPGVVAKSFSEPKGMQKYLDTSGEGA
ncbi:MAG: ACP S-malonyltransferase [Thermoanaerobaculia bacterium]